MPTTRSGKTTSNDPLIRNMKQESISPPRFPFSGTPDYLKQPKQVITAEETARKNPPRESSKKDNFQLCPANQVKTCHCPGLKVVIPPPGPDIPPCPKNLSKQFVHWDLTIKHK